MHLTTCNAMFFKSELLRMITNVYDPQVVIDGNVSFVDVTDLRMSREYSIYYFHWTRCEDQFLPAS